MVLPLTSTVYRPSKPFRTTRRLWTLYIIYGKINLIKSIIVEVYIAEKCICCGKKAGLINGSHLNNQVCDNCYFPVAGYLSAIKESFDSHVIDENYSQLIQKIESSSYSENGKAYLIKIADTYTKENKTVIQTKSINEQIRKDFKITTSFTFEGYKISKYHGLASGSTVLGTGIFSELNVAGSDLFGTESDSFSYKLEQAKNISINKMINDAINQGGNALISVTFDYINFPSNMIGVIANGTVVEIIEQEKSAVSNT